MNKKHDLSEFVIIEGRDMKTDIKRLNLLRAHFVSEREHKIFLLEEGEHLTNEERAILSDEIDQLLEKIDNIDKALSRVWSDYN